MAVNNTVSVKEYKLTGAGLTSFPITFEFTTDGSGNAENIHCQFATKGDDGTYTYSEEIAQGMATDQFQIDGGNVKYIDDAGNAGQNNYIVIYRSTPPSQLTDFIDNGSYSLDDIEKALDKLTFLIQERTGTPIGTYINVGVSLFFANFLQLVSKKDALETLFSWSDIDVADRPTLAGTIRYAIDAASRSLANTFDSTNTFTLVPKIGQDPSASEDATRKSWVDSQIATVNAKFPVATSNIANSAVTTAKIADSNVTTAKIANSNVTTAKIADGNVTLAKLRVGTETKSVSASWDEVNNRTTGSTTYNVANKILTSVTCNDSFKAQVSLRNSDVVTISISRSGNHAGTKTVTIKYVY